MKITSEELITKIRSQISVYQHNVESDNKARRYNINDRAEAFTVPLFKLIFGWDELVNLNNIQENMPGVDLGDYKNRVAVQVSSETTIAKVKDSLQQFVANEYFHVFDRLVIFMIQRKQKSYSETTTNKISSGKLDFNPKRDIIDLSDLLKFIKELSLENLKVVLEMFEDETGFVDTAIHRGIQEDPAVQFSAQHTPPYEKGFLNLIEIGFPDNIYIADWNFTKKELGTRVRNDRKLVQEALSQQGHKFAVDWVTFEKQVICFHDLSDEFLPLANIVDQGTVTCLSTAEFFGNPAYKLKFVELLQRCLQQKLFHLGIHWQHKEKEYIFVPIDGETSRSIEWKEQQMGTRTVYKQIADLKDKTKVYCHEHFAFETRFYELAASWFIAVKPDWFYSSNGYNRAGYAIEDKRNYKKRMETNQSVSTHVRFIQSFMGTNDPENTNQLRLFSQTTTRPRIYEFLWIKSRQELGGLPRLADNLWRGKSQANTWLEDPLFSQAEEE